jgi:hypothetical protein
LYPKILIPFFHDRRRHIKCDETKPSCQKCTKWKGFCEGYDTKPKSSSKKQNGEPPANAVTALTHRGRTKRVAPGHSTLPDDNILTVLIDVTNTPFSTQWESDYFTAWVNFSPQVAGDHTSGLYTSLITQFGWQDPAVQSAVMAVGALQFAFQNDSGRSVDRRAGVHYQNALARYGTALRLIASKTVDASSLRTVMLCCALFICFEALDRNSTSVHNHIVHGAKILRQFLKSVHAGTELNSCIKSPAPYVLEDSVIYLFQQLSMVSWSNLAMLPRFTQATLPGSYSDEKLPDDFPDMPTKFYDLAEAGVWLDLLSKCVIDAFRQSLERRDVLRATLGRKDLDVTEIEEGPRLSTKYCPALEQWLTAFEPLRHWLAGKRDEDMQSYIRSLVLMCKERALYLSSWSVQFRDYHKMVALTPQFIKFLDMLDGFPQAVPANDEDGESSSDDCSSHHSSHHSSRPISNGIAPVPFSLNGPVFMLFCCASKCRDKAVRARAERLLRAQRRQDGLWDSRAAVAIIEWTKQLEDEYEVDIGDPMLAWGRIRDRQVRFSNRDDICWLSAYRFNRATGEWYLREDEIRWQ